MNELTSEQKRTFLEWLKDIWDKIFGKNKVPAELRHIEKLFGKALTEAGEWAKTKSNKTNELEVESDDGIDFAIYYPSYLESDIIDNCIKLQNMGSVKNLTGKEFEKNGNKTLRERVVDFFDSFGNNVYSKEFGDVALTLSSVRSDLSHGLTFNKIISFAAIPEVIQKGVVIDYQKRGNGNYDRIVVAAPVKIANELYYVGVMLQRDYKSQRLYLHDVVSEKEAILIDSEHLSSNRGANDTDNLYMTSILQNALNVKEQFSISDEQYSIPEKSSDGQKLTNAQRKFFRNSKVRDENGRLLAVYHGTTHGAFTVFKDTDDIGYFFTNNKEVTKTYSLPHCCYTPHHRGIVCYSLFFHRCFLTSETNSFVWVTLPFPGGRVDFAKQKTG